MHHLSWLAALALLGAGALAGMINAIVGSGSLITFPTMVGIGLSPLVANVSNNVGLVFGNFSGVYGYRRELVGQSARIRSLTPWSAAGGLLGAGLLLWHPSAFKHVVPFLVLLGVAMVIVQPRLTRALSAREGRRDEGGAVLRVSIFLTGIYGGYFGAAQGVILLALLLIGVNDHVQRLNALKNTAVGMVNLLAGILFVAFAPVNWVAAGIVAISSIAGGQAGATLGRRLPAPVLRGVIVIGGLAIAGYLLR